MNYLVFFAIHIVSFLPDETKPSREILCNYKGLSLAWQALKWYLSIVSAVNRLPSNQDLRGRVELAKLVMGLKC